LAIRIIEGAVLQMKSRVGQSDSYHRKRGKNLGVLELIAIALGGMVGGGIFTILGISVSMIGAYTPIAITIGSLLAGVAAYSYIKLGVYYRTEGATYSFCKRVFPDSPYAASLIGWWVVFGYIATLALYAYTFASYAISGFAVADNAWVRKAVSGGVIVIFTLINVWSVKGMGKVEDLMVYTKLVILVVISFVLINNSNSTLPVLLDQSPELDYLAVLIVASITFVAYEGFQLVINAVGEMAHPETNIPRAIYLAILLAMVIYVVIAVGAILAIPFEDIIQNKEYALASGASEVLGHWGNNLVVLGALLATASAISGTLFGASRQMAVIARDGYFPHFLAQRAEGDIPVLAIVAMSVLAFSLILVGSLEVILEFGSVTFLLVSLLMAIANHKVRDLTDSSRFVTIAAIGGLSLATMLILFYEATNQPRQLLFILGLYAALSVGSWFYSRLNARD
jgi:amino acid transporter